MIFDEEGRPNYRAIHRKDLNAWGDLIRRLAKTTDDPVLQAEAALAADKLLEHGEKSAIERGRDGTTARTMPGLRRPGDVSADVVDKVIEDLVEKLARLREDPFAEI